MRIGPSVFRNAFRHTKNKLPPTKAQKQQSTQEALDHFCNTMGKHLIHNRTLRCLVCNRDDREVFGGKAKLLRVNGEWFE